VLASAVAVALVIAGISVAHQWRSRNADTASASRFSSVATVSASPSAPVLDPSPTAASSPPQAGGSSAVAVVTLQPCRASDLSVEVGFGGAAAGNVSNPFVLTNTGRNTCVLQGYPSRVQGWQDGRWQDLRFSQGTFFIDEDPSPSPVELAPGGQAELIFGTEDACNGANINNSKLYSRLLVTLQNQTSVELNGPVNAFCGLDVSSFHPLPIPQSSPPISSPGPLNALHVQMHAPTTATVGTTLSYTVTVSNPTNADIALDPCPTWQALIDNPVGPDGITQVSGPLDCASTPSVPAHGLITVQMHINVPTAAGNAKFVWWLTGGAASGEALAVVPDSSTAAPCVADHLRISLGQRQQAMNQPAQVIVFTNTSSTPCVLSGYPIVAGLDSARRQITQAQQVNAIYLGGATNGVAGDVRLAADADASSLVGGADQPIGGAASCPPDYAGLLVTPPGTTRSTHLDVDFPSCAGLEVTPVVAGSSGGLF
jgi:Protein of unknown function (DUF4232)